MEFKILGPLEVRDDGRELPCRGHKQRLLLAVLLMHRNEVVSCDRLVEALWGEDAPAGASKALQMHVLQLRKLLEPGRPPGASGRLLRTRSPGYVLSVSPEQLDADRFEQSVAQARAALAAGRAEQAGRQLSGALSLWRGPPLADLTVDEALQTDIARLEELRLAALEVRIDADLAVGRHAELIGELERLVARHPLRERIRAQLMLALYRAGRQAEALEVYRDTRTVLVDELGIEPGRELRDLEARILTHDSALAVPAPHRPSPQAGDDTRAEIVGRERELAQAVPLIAAALGGRGALLLVGGEPGIGKSRLAESLAARADAGGARVLVGRCWEAGGAPAYWPWVQALRPLLREADAGTLRAHVGAGASDLLPIFPELRELLGDVPAAPAPDSEGARFRLFDAFASFLRAAARAQPLAVFIDDLHAADAPSLLLLRFLAGQLDDAPILIVGCYRDTEEHREFADTLADLAREPTVHRLALRGLDQSGTARLLEAALGRAADDALAARVHTETHGNPLFAAEIGRLLAVDDSQRTADGELPIPRAVMEAIGRRLALRSEGCRNLLALASILGREFDPDALEHVSDLDEDAVFAALDEAAGSGLVGEVPGARGRLRFSHILVRDALYEDLPASRRLRLHRQVGDALEVLYARNPEPHLAELAHHYLAAGSRTAEKAIDYAQRAGDRAAAAHGYEEAARHYGSALRVIDTTGSIDVGRTCELLLSLGEVLSRAGSTQEARDALRRAATIAERAGMPDRLARAALNYGGRFIWARAGSDPALVPLLERALAAVGDRDVPTRVRLLARLASATRDDARRERRVALAQEAIDLARQRGDPATLAYALEGYWVAVEGPDTAGDGAAIGDELIEIGEAIGDKERVFAARDFRLQALWRRADRAAIDVELDALSTLADELQQPAQRWHVGTSTTMLALMEGRFDEAEGMILQTQTLGRRAESWNADVSQRLQLFVLRRAQGRLAELEPTFSRSVHEFPALLRFRCALAHLHAELGHESEARAIFDDLLARDLGHEHVDAEWLFSMSLLPDVCAYLGDRRAAATLSSLLHPYRDLYAQAPVEASFGSAARGLGVLATTLGRFDDAERHFGAALETERRMRARPWLAHAQHNLAAALVTRGAAGDLDRARGLLCEAVDGYRALHMDAWAARAAAANAPISGSR